MHEWAKLSRFRSRWLESSEYQPRRNLAPQISLAMTGMRRGECLALRWRDVDLDAGTIAVRRSVGVVRVKGEGARVVEGQTKTSRPRVVDVDPATVALLRSWKRDRGTLALALARDGSLVFGDLDGRHRHPERFSRHWNQTLARAIRDGLDVPAIRLHDLRHTNATLLQMSGDASDASFPGRRDDGAVRA